MDKITPADVNMNRPDYWASFNKIALQAGPFSFAGHEYQVEPMKDTSRRLCYIKATGGGFSELEILKTLHGCIYRRFPRGALYLFPTSDDVQEFSKSRFGPLIESNPLTIGKYVKSHGKGADTATLKKIGDAFLYLRGARLSQSAGPMTDAKESTKLRGIQVDVVKFDESELMDEESLAKARGRMGASFVKEEVYISNPGLPDYGIDNVFQKSDQRYWFRKCSCGKWFSADEEFPGCVKIRENGTGYIGCPKCGKEVPFCNGEGTGQWVAKIHDNTDYMAGYHWSHLTSLNNDPAEILEEYQNPPQGNLGDIYRLRLGLPYVAAEDRLSPGAVKDCCGRELQYASHPGPCAMGVDVGKIKHVVIGIRTGAERYEIVKVIAVSRWEDIHDLAWKFNVRSAVIDIRPYEDEARKFQTDEQYRIFLCEYNESTAIPVQFNDASGIVRVNRTEIFDKTHRWIMAKQLAIPRQCPEVDNFIKQCCNCAKVLETNKRTGTAIFRYRALGSGGDHYRNALNYFSLAARFCSVYTKHSRFRHQEKTISEYQVI